MRAAGCPSGSWPCDGRQSFQNRNVPELVNSEEAVSAMWSKYRASRRRRMKLKCVVEKEIYSRFLFPGQWIVLGAV